MLMQSELVHPDLVLDNLVRADLVQDEGEKNTREGGFELCISIILTSAVTISECEQVQNLNRSTSENDIT